MRDYLKEEIATIREVVKLIVVSIIALIGGVFSIIINIINKNYDSIILVFAFIGAISILSMFMFLKRYWNRLYELKEHLRRLDE